VSMWALLCCIRGSAFTGAGASEKVETAGSVPRFTRMIPEYLEEVERRG
jgi:hypothetical protein